MVTQMGRVILVCGGREYGRHDLTERLYAYRVLDALHADNPITLLVHGNARGADRVAKRWAELRNVPQIGYEPDWDDLTHPDAVIRKLADGTEYDAAAGNRRNQLMLDTHPEIELVVAFPGGTGTADMCAKARKKHILIQHEVRCN